MPVTPRCASPNVLFDKGELRACLEPLEYHVTQEKGTERPFTNKGWMEEFTSQIYSYNLFSNKC